MVCMSCEGVSSWMTQSFTWPDWYRAQAASSGLAVSSTWLEAMTSDHEWVVAFLGMYEEHKVDQGAT